MSCGKAEILVCSVHRSLTGASGLPARSSRSVNRAECVGVGVLAGGKRMSQLRPGSGARGV